MQSLRRLLVLLLAASAACSKPAAPFVAALTKVALDIKYRFFFPGHNGGSGAPTQLKQLVNDGGLLRCDLPELDGLDNIHSPEGPLLESLTAAAELFGAKRSWYLLNGSTGGILCAVLAIVRLHEARAGINGGAASSGSAGDQGPVMLIGRDSHKAVFDALSLANCDAALLPCHIDSSFGVPLGVQLPAIRQAVERYGSRVCGLVLTRPTYQGVAYSTEALTAVAAYCRESGFALLLDEAHGSHLRFLDAEAYPGLRDGISCGADVVVQSSHKTLSSLSQTGMLHTSHTSFAYLGEPALSRLQPEQVLHDTYSMLTTTSPNSILLASLDATVAQMAAEGVGLVGAAAAKADALRQALRDAPLSRAPGDGGGACKDVEILDDSADLTSSCGGLVVDPLRLSVRFASRDSTAVDDAMCEAEGIYCELNLKDCLTYGVPLGVPDAQMQLLSRSLLSRAYAAAAPVPRVGDAKGSADITFLSLRGAASGALPEVVDALSVVSGAEAGRLLSADSVYLYPPGIPLLVRGEVVTAAQVSALLAAHGALQSGCQIFGAADATLRTLRVLRQA